MATSDSTFSDTALVKGDLPSGLSADEVHRRLEKFGPNAIPDTSQHPLRRALEKFWAPVPWMLEAAVVLELVLGKYVEAAVIAALLVFNAGLGLIQESRAQATLAALKSRLALSAAVRRDYRAGCRYPPDGVSDRGLKNTRVCCDRVRQSGDDLCESYTWTPVVLSPQCLAGRFIRERCPDRLHLGPRRNRNDAPANIGGGSHTDRGGCVFRDLGFHQSPGTSPP